MLVFTYKVCSPFHPLKDFGCKSNVLLSAPFLATQLPARLIFLPDQFYHILYE